MEKAEADKILAVKAAEAEAEAKHLSGKLRNTAEIVSRRENVWLCLLAVGT